MIMNLQEKLGHAQRIVLSHTMTDDGAVGRTCKELRLSYEESERKKKLFYEGND
jgi:hypothetical protein